MIRTFGEHLRKEIRKDMEELTDAIAGGNLTSYEEYAHYTGVIKGLAYAERHVLDLMDAAEKNSDED